MMHRRTFLKNISALGAMSLLPFRFFGKDRHIPVGIQLWSVRELVSSDFEGTMKILASIGYETIEAAGYNDRKFYGLSPLQYKSFLEGLGLNPLSSHSGVTLENADAAIEDTLSAGMKYLVLPSLPQEKRKSADDYKTIAHEMNLIGEKCRQSGLMFGYHNHAFEFEMLDGEIPYDILLRETDPDLVTMQADVYWMVYAGVEPAYYFRNYPGRFEMWHVKDMEDSPERENTEVGSGIIDFQKLFELAAIAGLRHSIVEQESFTMDPIESITQSYKYLKSL
ncbi:MAG: sugar phosphate isomerase/epimerase family protein [Bacteroidales bacterium]